MEKVSNVNRKKIIIGAVLLISLIFIVIIGAKTIQNKYGKIDDVVIEADVVFTPERPADRFYYDLFSIDVFEYWVFKLEDEEKYNVLNEVENGNWSEMTLFHVGKIKSLYGGRIFKKSFENHKCLICIYDKKSKTVINDSENEIWEDTTKWIIFLYDTEDNRYYCIYETV